MTEQEVIEIVDAKINALEISLIEKLEEAVTKIIAEITG
jgi:hypothetical protein